MLSELVPLMERRGNDPAPIREMRAASDAGENPTALLVHHRSGDWGEVVPDARENELSVLRGFRILSRY